ncbi:hypothetical protein [Aurantimonas sp. VKM B-3413]|uniref:hypothetical protein n=1 Tax=Aurantimonas sp. VKM B-3413 TaxID=2779401 RepID=UPI001E31AFA7|nr:hypothetical protein [Aurantimonas sp. VKM B-3413]MCB8837018.1 hypothetical protein [Aurantimonas sp. VKM B-3413]
MIWVTFRRVGIHCWPDAPEGTHYLRHPHRHVFHFRVWIEVFHGDREVEFHAFLRWIEGLYDDGMLQLGSRSCEMLADELYASIAGAYGGREVWIEVSEDGENGCCVRYLSRERHCGDGRKP